MNKKELGKVQPYSGRKLGELLPFLVKCAACGRKVDRGESLCDYRLKNSVGSYCRFCKNCKEIFEKKVLEVDDPVGLVFSEGIEVDLGDKDPFFKIRYYAVEDELPSWKVVPHDEDSGGLLVFVRRVGSYAKAAAIGDRPQLTCKVKITKKSSRVAFAEPHLEEVEETENTAEKFGLENKSTEISGECPLKGI